ncbi:methyltransferase, TIGR00027 family [Sinosporangium album]|uniref:S-adenosyl-L-methionine-dependent methyltransferase n=1 Tax=Sinosporangium album TaxID=504805 RepID=A0A1G8A5R7_9ACTN|nr:SAM-dependent methyltransferase [Sinosporangium album]SDH16315.1 methyltransferase, TIGR00027 family [Sinosporangium album]
MTEGILNSDHKLGGVAQTARWTAASRARESRRPDRLFDDPLAALLAGPHAAALLRHFHTSRAADEGNPFLPIRTRWFDDFLRAKAGKTGHQVVGLGAGLDTRAHRLDWPDGTVIFEVDQAALLAYKKERLSTSASVPRCDCRTVPVNLGDDWESALMEQGFDPTAPTVWFAEGLLFYLPEPLAHQVVSQAVKLSAAGSGFAADLIGTGIFRLPYIRPFLDRLNEAGSPWVFGTDDPRGFVERCGWRVTQVTEPGRPGADYGRWPKSASPSNLPDLPRSYLVAAELP